MTFVLWGDNYLLETTTPNAKLAILNSSEPSASQLYRLHNEIWFNCSVSTVSINKLIKLIYETIHDEKLSAYKDLPDGMEIVIHIDSSGGILSAAFKYIDFVESLRKKGFKFRTIINGRAMSAGTLMAIVADIRQITTRSYAMIHELSGGYSGHFTKIKSWQKHIDSCHAKVIDVYMEYQRDTENKEERRKELEVLLNTESYFNAEEYLKLGFVDEILNKD